jgi:hypothetical protein
MKSLIDTPKKVGDLVQILPVKYTSNGVPMEFEAIFEKEIES